MNLSILLITPLVSALLLLPAGSARNIQRIALAGAVVQLLLCCYLFYAFIQERHSGNESSFLFESEIPWYTSLNIIYHTGIDGISLLMILLTAVVMLSGILISGSVNKLQKEYYWLLLLLCTGAFGFFISLDLFSLFFFLELAVIPKFLLIGIWGSGKKEYSAMKLALLLMAGSACIFIGLAGIYVLHPANSFDLIALTKEPFDPSLQRIFFPFAFLGFGFFSALFPFHTWVPDGHSSAPTAASMFLAGISMKLGGYGCLRAAVWLMPEAAAYYQPWMVALATTGILYGAFATMMQKDLKYMNAYSSVSHTGFVLLGISLLNEAGFNGAVLQMISHGLMTALFFAVIGMIYERTHTRQINEMGGLMQAVPYISTIFLIVALCSLGLPGLSGFVAEMTILTGGWQLTETSYRIAVVLSAASIVVTAVYLLRAAGTSIMGKSKSLTIISMKDAGSKEKTSAVLLLGGILLMGLAPFLFIPIIEKDTKHILKQSVLQPKKE